MTSDLLNKADVIFNLVVQLGKLRDPVIKKHVHDN